MANNEDFHNQGGTREPVTMLFESTSEEGQRRLFLGTRSKLAFYDSAATDWTIVGSGLGAVGLPRFRAAELSNQVLFTNDFDPVKIHTLGSGSVSGIGELEVNVGLSKAKVIAQFQGFILLMNTYENGQRFSSRVRWCEHKDPTQWIDNDPDTVAGFQDLDYGDEILAAAQLGGNLIIYTTRSIWRCYLQDPENDLVFGFQRVYSEPKNSSGCIAYPNTLVSSGDAHRYFGKDAIYKWTAYSSAPEREGWIDASSAIIFSGEYPSTQIDPAYCDGPVGEYQPSTFEVTWSWPDTESEGINRHSLVANIRFSTCDYRDVGWTALCNFSEDQTCKTAPSLLVGANGRDYALKQIGGVFYREQLSLPEDDPTVNIEEPVYFATGYNSILRGQCPFLYPQNKKRVRKVTIQHDTVDQDDPCIVQLRLGKANHVTDPNVESGKCAVLWMDEGNRALACPDSLTPEAMALNNLTPAEDTHWNVFREAKYLYFELTVKSTSGNGIGGDSAWSSIDFEARLQL